MVALPKCQHQARRGGDAAPIACASHHAARRSGGKSCAGRRCSFGFACSASCTWRGALACSRSGCRTCAGTRAHTRQRDGSSADHRLARACVRRRTGATGHACTGETGCKACATFPSAGSNASQAYAR